jgi:hypothetical protein
MTAFNQDFGLPYDIGEEVNSINQEKLSAEGLAPSSEERLVVAENRAIQFGLILARNLRSCGIDPTEIAKILRILGDQVPDDGTIAKSHGSLTRAMVQARIEFRRFLGLEEQEKNTRS